MEDPTESSAEKIIEFWRIYRLPILLGIFSLTLIIISIVLLFQTRTEPIKFNESRNSQDAKQFLTVDVEGAVLNPGVYKLPFGSRVDDAIKVAGGLTSSADLQTISTSTNRAAKLVDGAKIFFPQTGSADLPSVSGIEVTGTVSKLININTASTGELDTLPGIGEVSAAKIISNRPYQTLEELVAKKAVTQSVFNKIKSLITL